MKKLIMINGTMGVGKSTVCNKLLNLLSPSVYLDGDWCWNMNPFVVSEENKEMVINNISYLLKSYLNNSGYEYIIFCWVMHEEYILMEILEKLKEFDFQLYKLSLICTEEALRKRLNKDVVNSIRKADVISRSIERITAYEEMDTVKIDVSSITAEETANKIYSIVK
ncbi:AAA family ATPase [Clostridium sp. C2-6-12]|uniref:AAA family ATPase n=1 Tax=Clostridium sp. C2-6-12 TaxID=2698832 RepID=UPI00136B7B33|nr:AAA family ATPase [Clostridium sp. C2-6-12]